MGVGDLPDNEDERPRKLHGDGNAVGSRVIAVLGGVVDNGSQQETDGNSELVGSDNGSTDPLGCSLGLVHGDQGRDQTNSVSSEETASNEQGLRCRSRLEDDTKVEDETSRDHETDATTEEVTDGGSSESTEESTGGENGDDERVLGGCDLAVGGCGEGALPVVHGEDTGDCASVVSVEDTTKGDEETNDDGRPVNGGSVMATASRVRWTTHHAAPAVPSGCFMTNLPMM
jgi:hypothetical protein